MIEVNTTDLTPEQIEVVNGITCDNYAEGAERTEASVALPIGRLGPDVLTLLVEAMDESVAVGKKFDVLKRHIFYGKEFDESTKRYIQAHVRHASRSFEWMDASLARASQPELVRLIHAACGLQTETSEIHEQLFSHIFKGTPLDKVNLAEEFGDAMWYIGIGCRVLGVKLTQILRKNIAKLLKRFPLKFTSFLALNRNLDAERAILEANQ